MKKYLLLLVTVLFFIGSEMNALTLHESDVTTLAFDSQSEPVELLEDSDDDRKLLVSKTASSFPLIKYASFHFKNHLIPFDYADEVYRPPSFS